MLQIPTDKLYKFTAIFGLSLVIAGVSLIYIEVGKYRETDSQLQGLLTEADIQTKLSNLSRSEYEGEKDKLFVKLDEGTTISKAEINHFRSTADKFDTTVKNYCEFVSITAPKIAAIRNSQKYTPYYFGAFSTLIFIGIILSFFGFKQWSKNA
jgi:hypothetical protein